jgi:hypothetical protein
MHNPRTNEAGVFRQADHCYFRQPGHDGFDYFRHDGLDYFRQPGHDGSIIFVSPGMTVRMCWVLLPRLHPARLVVAHQAIEMQPDVGGFRRGIGERDGAVEGDAGLIVAA